MDSQVLPLSSNPHHFAAYDRGSVERFLSRAFEERSRLLGEIAAGRHRIADAKAGLAASNDPEYRCVGRVQEGLRVEQRVHDEAVRAILTDAETEAERILAGSGTPQRALRGATASVVAASPASPAQSGNGAHFAAIDHLSAAPFPGSQSFDTGLLASPDLVDVVQASDVDPAVTAVKAELAALGRELTAVVAKAERLEDRLREARGRPDGSDTTTALLERVFAETILVARAEHRRALQRAEDSAERKIAAARARADRLKPQPQPPQDSPAAAGISWAAPTGPPATHASTEAPAPRWNPPAGPTDPPAPSRAPAPVMAFDDESNRYSSPAPATEIVARPPQAPSRATPSRPPIAKPMLLDIVLPLIAVAIVLLIVLSWLG